MRSRTVVFFFIRFGLENYSQPVSEYLRWHLFLPGGINLVLYLDAVLFQKHYEREKDERAMNYVPVMTLVLMSAVIGTFHYSYPILMALFLPGKISLAAAVLIVQILMNGKVICGLWALRKGKWVQNITVE